MPRIKCPYCKKLNTKLTDGVRNYKRGYIRMRKCNDCGHKFTTIEKYCTEIQLMLEEQEKDKK